MSAHYSQPLARLESVTLTLGFKIIKGDLYGCKRNILSKSCVRVNCG